MGEEADARGLGPFSINPDPMLTDSERANKLICSAGHFGEALPLGPLQPEERRRVESPSGCF
jgi:hypothetical protein